MTSWYPPPPKPAYKPIRPRALLPIHQAPLPANLPALPSPPREPVCSRYSLTTHIIPAAFPLTTPDVPLPPPLQDGWDKEQRKEWICVNRYVKKSRNENRKGGITLLFTHANGFPKEIWEPIISHLSGSAIQLVDEIWSWEAVQHGDAALLNAMNISGAYDASDDSRDILDFLLYYLPSSASHALLPTHLPRISSIESDARKSKGFCERSLVAVGHSFGGCTSTLAALTYPSLFSSLILVDPIIVMSPHSPKDHESLRYLPLGALLRRETWSSLRSQEPFCNPILCILGSLSSVDLPFLWPDRDYEGSVKLKIPSFQEALVFAYLKTSYETWDRLDKSDESIETRWIVPGNGDDSGVVGKTQTQERVWRRPVNSDNVIINSAGHLIPHECPRELGKEISKFLENKYGVERDVNKLRL